MEDKQRKSALTDKDFVIQYLPDGHLFTDYINNTLAGDFIHSLRKAASQNAELTTLRAVNKEQARRIRELEKS